MKLMKHFIIKLLIVLVKTSQSSNSQCNGRLCWGPKLKQSNCCENDICVSNFYSNQLELRCVNEQEYLRISRFYVIVTDENKGFPVENNVLGSIAVRSSETGSRRVTKRKKANDFKLSKLNKTRRGIKRKKKFRGVKFPNLKNSKNKENSTDIAKKKKRILELRKRNETKFIKKPYKKSTAKPINTKIKNPVNVLKVDMNMLRDIIDHLPETTRNTTGENVNSRKLNTPPVSNKVESDNGKNLERNSIKGNITTDGSWYGRRIRNRFGLGKDDKKIRQNNKNAMCDFTPCLGPKFRQSNCCPKYICVTNQDTNQLHCVNERNLLRVKTFEEIQRGLVK